MASILIISNGHGEDLSGALIAKALISIGNKVDAFAMVGKGNTYTNKGISNLGLGREFSTGGIGYTSLLGRLTELVQGQLIYLLRSILRLLSISKKYDLLVVVGDVVPILAAWLMRIPSVVYLVAYSSHYEGKLSLPWPCKPLLLSKYFRAVYSRDELTAKDLAFQLKKPVLFLGNPFMDTVFASEKALPASTFRLGLIPGSRRPELDKNISMLLKVILLLPERIFTRSEFSVDMALVNSINKQALEDLVVQYGWKINALNNSQSSIQITNEPYSVTVHWNSFSAVVQSSDLLFAMAGTAAEQAVGLAKPVVQLPGPGPQFTPSFAEAQRRLLGPTVFCAKFNNKSSQNIYKDTAILLLDLYELIRNDDQSFKDECINQALLRLGKAGGSKRIARSINDKYLHELD